MGKTIKTIILFLFICLACTSFRDAEQPDDIITTTDADSPIHVFRAPPAENAIVINGVPAYKWHHGCTPTAVGMFLGYWDMLGYDVLPGVKYAVFWNDESKNAVASSEHYADYARPIDLNEAIPDKSELGGAHADNSIADCLQTSRSVFSLRYGWTSTHRIRPCLLKYTNNSTLTGIVSTCPKNCVDFITSELSAGKPILSTVYTGSQWHNMVIVGYGEGYYGALNTWSREIVWYPYSECMDGTIAWCINGSYALNIKSKVPVTPVKVPQIHLPIIER